MLIKILLIEDDPVEVNAFKRAIARISPDVKVVDAADFNHAFHCLRGDVFDRVFIDPELQTTAEFGKAIQDFVRFAPDTPIQIMKSRDPAVLAIIRQLANANDNVELIEKNDRDALAGILEKLIKEKSSGSLTGLKVDQARLDVKIEGLEKGQQKIEATVEKSMLELRKMVAQLSGTISELSIKLAMAMETIDQSKKEIAALRDELHDVSLVAESAASKKEVDPSESEKNKIFVTWIVAGCPVIIAIAVPIVNHFFPSRKEEPPAIIAPSPSPSPSNGANKK